MSNMEWLDEPKPSTDQPSLKDLTSEIPADFKELTRISKKLYGEYVDGKWVEGELTKALVGLSEDEIKRGALNNALIAKAYNWPIKVGGISVDENKNRVVEGQPIKGANGQINDWLDLEVKKYTSKSDFRKAMRSVVQIPKIGEDGFWELKNGVNAAHIVSRNWAWSKGWGLRTEKVKNVAESAEVAAREEAINTTALAILTKMFSAWRKRGQLKDAQARIQAMKTLRQMEADNAELEAKIRSGKIDQK